MNIIPLEIKNEAQNLIKNVFLNKCSDLFKSYMDNLFFNCSKNKYITMNLNIQRDIWKCLIETLKYSINVIDRIFMNSDYRKNNLYISKQKIQRTIVETFGTITFERNYYCDKDKQNGFFMIDELFGFEKYKTYSQIIRGLLINEATNTNVNKAVNNSLIYDYNILNYLSKNSNSIPSIPRQTVYNWIKNMIDTKINYEPKQTSDTLYVMADEKWIHEQIRKCNLPDYEQNKKHYIMSKCFVIFTGAKTNNKRTKLLNRHVFITSSKTPWKDLMNKICKIYDFEKIKIINLLSDSGGWIISGKDELKLYSHNKIIVNTCEFHVIQKIHRITSKEELRQTLIDVIYNQQNKKVFIEEMDKIIEEKPNRKEKLTEYKNYIIKHWKSILNMKTCNIKSSMESHISHFVAEHFGSRPKGYSESTIETYLKLQEAKVNGINILDFCLKSAYQEDNYIYNEKEVSFSIFDKNTSVLPVCSSNNPISIVMHNIAYSY